MSHYRLPFYRSFLFQLSLFLSFLAIVPVLLITYLNYNYASRILNDTTAAGLYAIAQYQSKNIQEFIGGVQKNIHLLSQTPTFVEALDSIFHASVSTCPKQELKHLEPTLNAHSLGVFKRFIDELNFKNIFLASPDCQALYNIAGKGFLEETDNTLALAHKRQLLLKTLELTYMVMSPQVSDFALNAKEEDPCLLFSCPVFLKGVLIGLLAVEVAPESIYNILNNYTGLDETGETFVSQQKHDKVILLNPPRNAEHAVFEEDAFAQQSSSATYKALRGERGFGPAVDYRGKPVLAAWEYLPRLRWSLVVKKDLSEVLNPSMRLQNITLSTVFPSVCILAVIALFVAKTISAPLAHMAQNALKIAAGNVQDVYVFSQPNNELKLLSKALYAMQTHLKNLVAKTKSTEVLITDLQLKTFQSSYAQAKAMYTHKTFLKRISRLSKQAEGLNKGLIHTVQALSQIAHKGALEADASQHKLKTLIAIIESVESAKMSLEKHFEELQKQVKVLQGIFFNTLKMADRSNILALNTTLEVHQMAQSTLGFRIVAQEIQKLSQEMDEACLGVENSTQAMEQSMHQSSNYLKQLSKMVHEESIGASLLQGYLDKAMASISYLPEALKKGLNSLEQQLETIQGLDSSIQAMQHSTEYKLKDLDMNKTLIHRLRDHNLHLEKEVAEFKI